ncbi:MAG TPA: SpoIIE family protein phosphatase [Acidobacteriaceae bacterium]|nr:SpoIIE family protein phosphatase [Acidobacteriaceae bacterium]
MRSRSWLLSVLLVSGLLGARAQTVDATGWKTGGLELTSGWVTHAGDNPGWAAPSFDDSAWKPVEIDDIGASQPGWRWFRLQVKLAENHPHIHLLIVGGDGVYELYVNGQKADGPELRSQFGASRPTERVISVDSDADTLQLALRTHAPISYTGWHLPLFLDFKLGTEDSIETAREAAQSQRLYVALPAIAINLLLILAGIASFALFRSQRTHKEYLWLGFYLLFLGTSNLLLNSSTSGVIPLDWNNLLGDPLIYFFTIMQIEFTFSFAEQRVGRIWRMYEALLVAMIIVNWLTSFGALASSIYVIVEALVVLPAALLLPVLLFVWYRRGNREAGWLILPSLLPTAATAVADVGTASIFFGWGKLDFLANPIPVGATGLQPADIGDLLFLLAIAVVMFFRFTRVSREQARTAAELDAAREMQRRMVPVSLPAVPGYAIEAAYLPAAEVGGDFYQVLGQRDGSTMVVVGDVSGKGLKAAMTGTLALGALRTLAAEGLGPAALLTRLNEQIVSAQEDGFITCLCVRIAPAGRACAANAGHLIPYRNGEEIEIESGLPLGVTPESAYSEAAFTLAPGDMLTLLSDGVVEAMTASGELFGFARTQAISRRRAEEIAESARQFGQKDDITVLTLTLTGAGAVHA